MVRAVRPLRSLSMARVAPRLTPESIQQNKLSRSRRGPSRPVACSYWGTKNVSTRPGSFSEVSVRTADFRSSPNSGHRTSGRSLPNSANFGLSVLALWAMFEPAYLNSCPYLRAIALICSRVNSFRGSPGRLQVSRKKPSRPGGTMIHSRTSS